jgi:hypothetical protein
MYMGGCTCSPIINSAFRAEFIVPVIRHPLLKEIRPGRKGGVLAYLLASPQALGRYREDRKGFQIVVRPVGCMKAIITSK